MHPTRFKFCIIMSACPDCPACAKRVSDGNSGSDDPNDFKLSICSNCGKTADGEAKQYICSRCKSAKYCDKECQRNHWRIHKPVCAKTVEMNASSNLGKDMDAWMKENHGLLQAFMLNALRAFGGPEISRIGTQYAVLMGTYDVANRKILLTDYSVAPARIFEGNFSNFAPSGTVYASVALIVNGIAKLTRLLDDPELLSAYGNVSAAVQDERAENIFQNLKVASADLKLSVEKDCQLHG